MGIYTPANKLENLKLYKYSSEDHSFVSQYILKRYWNWFTTLFPLSMAPNLITLLGLMFIIVSVLLVFYYDPYMDTATPSWVYFAHAFNLFMYQTFDGCDGCHARRTGQLGPLGELFDHSIDAINTSLLVFVTSSVLHFGAGYKTLFAQFSVLANFYASTWETYHTHTLFLSAVSGPVEGMILLQGMYALTGFIGPSVWTAHVLDLDLSSLGFGLQTYPIDVSHFLIAFGFVGIYFNVAAAAANVAKKYYSNLALSKDTAKQEIANAKEGLLPFAVFFVFQGFFLWSFPDVATTYCHGLLITTGSTMAFCVGRIILAHLTLQDFPFFQTPTLVPLLQTFLAHYFITFNGYRPSVVLPAVVWGGMGLTIGIHAMFITEIILEITQFLDIYALTIKHKKI